MARADQLRTFNRNLYYRQTRARVNKYLNELKSLIAKHLQPESFARLTKADVLELTVTHLKKLKKLQSRNQPTIKPIPSGQDKFRGGCCRCVSLVSHSLASVPSNETNTQSSNSDIGNKNGYDVCGKGEIIHSSEKYFHASILNEIAD